ncbi:MAG: amidohydrolase family protein, partial [Oscillospiraceae bacterium]|nr:amidohydrolase family protein [Oscillospiraceae bacterium]
TQKEQLEATGRHGKPPASVMLDAGILELPVTAAHCVWITDSDMELLAEKKVTVAHCPQSNLKLGSGIARIQKMRHSGINVALGTDSAASNNNLDMFQEVKAAALLAKGVSLNPCEMPAGDALYMATRAGALSQERDDSGDIIQGNRADFVILNTRQPAMIPCHNVLSNVIYAAGAGDVEMTVVDGRVLYRNGVYTTLDIERIMYEVNRCVNALI